MFMLQPKRNIEDCFINTHDPLITQVMGHNNNVLFCMTGPIVMCATSYNTKPQQKEESEAFEQVGKALCGVMNRQA